MITMPVLATSLALAPATTARATASHAPLAPASAISWHLLRLRSGWTSAQRRFGTGNPAWAAKGNVIYLSGSVLQLHGAAGEFAVLPPAARPAHALRIAVVTRDLTGRFLPAGYLYIGPGGTASALGSFAGQFTSLAGVSYPARPVRSHKLSLQNGWLPLPRARDAGYPGYDLMHGVVYLSGGMHQPAASTDNFARLPRSCWPLHGLIISVHARPRRTATVQINTSGFMYADFGSARISTFLGGVSFLTASVPVHPLALVNGWHATDPADRLSYVVHDGVVYLAGEFAQFPAGSNVLARLPRDARPSHVLYLKAFAYTGNFTVATVQIDPSGYILALNDRTSSLQAISFAAISFPAAA